MARETLALVCHGSVSYHCHGSFIVPPSIRLAWFYDPAQEDTVLCFSESDIPQICSNKAKAPIKHISNPGDRCPNLLLMRADDIHSRTGFFNCRTNMWISARRLGNPEVDTNLPIVAACLSDVLNDLVEETMNEPFDIYILACGQTMKYIRHESRVKVINPATGQITNLESHKKNETIRKQAYNAGERYFKGLIQQGIDPSYAQAKAVEISQSLYATLSKIGGRRKRSKNTRRKRGHKRTRKN